MAYSPAPTVETSTTYTLNTGRNGLFIFLNAETPDILYASNNTDPQPYNKTSGTVDLGEFRHALSQLTVQVLAGEDMASTVRVKELSVTTPARTATLFLPSGDDGLEVTQSPEDAYEREFVDQVTDFTDGKIEGTLLLFPGTEGVTQINLSLIDTSNQDSFSRSYLIPFFTNVDNPNDPVTLQRAKNTTLRIRVNQTVVQNPNEDVILEGTIRDWVDGGSYGVSIN
ncbi:MAG: fimbrillin family protein [Rikenellaceae bacterium]|nr:fimbrillin family protein [Rikenellaceae bacterium]